MALCIRYYVSLRHFQRKAPTSIAILLCTLLWTRSKIKHMVPKIINFLAYYCKKWLLRSTKTFCMDSWSFLNSPLPKMLLFSSKYSNMAFISLQSQKMYAKPAMRQWKRSICQGYTWTTSAASRNRVLLSRVLCAAYALESFVHANSSCERNWIRGGNESIPNSICLWCVYHDHRKRQCKHASWIHMRQLDIQQFFLFQDAPVKLNALFAEDLRVSWNDLINHIMLHYRDQVIFQVHKVLGSVDILGNPVGLFNTLSSGFGELFYEPYQGFILSDRPQDLGIGIARVKYRCIYLKAHIGFHKLMIHAIHYAN